MSIVAVILMAMAAATGDQGEESRGDDLQLVCYGGAQKTTTQVNSGFE